MSHIGSEGKFRAARALLCALVLLAAAGPAGAEKTGPTRTAVGKLVKYFDNGMGNTLVLRVGKRKVSIFNPPDGSGAGLESVKKGERIEVTWREERERAVKAVHRGDCQPRAEKKGRCIAGTLRKVTQGDLGKYFALERDGKETEHLGDFEPKGNLDEKADIGKRVALSFSRPKLKRWLVSFKKAPAP
jgi:hypothetical protein